MRTPFVAGNWKMNKTIAETRELVTAMKTGLSGIAGVEKVICPPFMSLAAASELLKDLGIGLGAQNLHWEEKGAFTGEVAPGLVKELCGYVILGHSERRAYFGETDETVNRKLLATQKFDLTPDRLRGGDIGAIRVESDSCDVVMRQTGLGLKGISAEFAPRIVVAYEPVWAIGTGKASNGKEANSVVKDFIRPAIAELYGEQTAQAIRVLYGGSVTSANAAEFFSEPDIDGALVGGASLKLDDFVQIVTQSKS